MGGGGGGRGGARFYYSLIRLIHGHMDVDTEYRCLREQM